MAPVNAWAGERLLSLSGEIFVLKATMDIIARLMAALEAETLESLGEKLSARRPVTLSAALSVFLGPDEAVRAMALAAGMAGLTDIYAALAGAISGMTPDEEAEAKKADAARADALRGAAMSLLARRLNSGESPSPTG